MADFQKAYDWVLPLEFGWVNDPNDTGGETLDGISRANFPKNPIWPIVDSLKGQKNFIDKIRSHPTLPIMVREWYKTEWWDKFNCNLYTQDVANEILEMAVNVGHRQATIFIQKACNALNYKNQYGPDLKVDGVFGSNTRTRVQNICVTDTGATALRNGINSLQGAFYVELANSKAQYKKYTKGWLFNRAK